MLFYTTIASKPYITAAHAPISSPDLYASAALRQASAYATAQGERLQLDRVVIRAPLDSIMKDAEEAVTSLLPKEGNVIVDAKRYTVPWPRKIVAKVGDINVVAT